MKKIIVAALAVSLLAAGMAFGQVKAKDGLYYAIDTAFSQQGWKDQVVAKVVGGKITELTWSGISNQGVADKVTFAAAGGYGMAKAAKLGEWNVQAKATTDWVLKTQNVAGKFTKEGTADGIAGASLHVNGFFALLNKALASAPVAKGVFKKDGWFFASTPDFDAKTGWKDNVLVTVVNGTIVDLIWNGLNKDPSFKSKLITAETGKYGMAAAAKQGEWNVQAAKVQDAIIKAGDPAKIPLKADGTTDAIAGATLHPTAVSLAIEALKPAR